MNNNLETPSDRAGLELCRTKPGGGETAGVAH